MTRRFALSSCTEFMFPRPTLGVLAAALAFCWLCASPALLAQNTFPSSGNVGVGTTSPTATLDVYASGSGLYTPAAIIAGPGQVPVYLYSGSTFTGVLKGDGGGNLVVSSGAGDLLFGTGANGTSTYGNFASITVTPSGYVGIGTTDPCTNSQSGSITNCKLSVAGAIQAEEVVVNSGWS
ncbi:MAG TPA: hypothetical protein VH640_12390, partial [Bryobacteraceae bacterium]